jgi:hypothetical protein
MKKASQVFLVTLMIGVITLFLYFPSYFRLDFSHTFFGTVAALILIYNAYKLLNVRQAADLTAVSQSREGYQTLMLFTAALCFQFGSINENIFGSDPTRASLYDGFFTNGGYMPNSDSAHYLISIQAFLSYGMTVSLSEFRPLATFWSAFLYKISGESMILYFYLQAFLSAIGICASAMALRRYLAWGWVLLFTWFLSTYVGLLQGTFLTELTSMPFALLSFSLLLYGWFIERKSMALIGVSMLALTFEMRPAVFFFPPILFLLYSLLSYRTTRFRWKPFFVAMMIYLATSISCRIFIKMLSFPPTSISNTYGKLYQIYQGSDAWDEVNNLYPKTRVLSQEILNEYRQEYVYKLIRQNPIPLIKNYLVLLKKSLDHPNKLFEVINPMISKQMSILLLSSILTGIFIHKANRFRRLLHYLVLGYLLSVFFSLPFLHAELRVMSATQVLFILAYVLSLGNIWLITIRLMKMIPFFDVRYQKYDPYNYERQSNNRDMQFARTITVSSFMILVLVMISPLIIDKIRPPLRQSLVKLQDVKQYTRNKGHHFFILDTHNDPGMKFVAAQVKSTVSPPKMSINRLLHRWVLDSSMQHGFYLFSAINHLRFPVKKGYNDHLIVPDKILSGIDLKHSDALLLEVRRKDISVNGTPLQMIIAERILSIEYDQP